MAAIFEYANKVEGGSAHFADGKFWKFHIYAYAPAKSYRHVTTSNIFSNFLKKRKQLVAVRAEMAVIYSFNCQDAYDSWYYYSKSRITYHYTHITQNQLY